MHVTVLDGTHADDPLAAAAQAALQQVFASRQWRAEWLVLRDMDIPLCVGCFECWIHTPGQCIAKGDCDRLARSFIRSDLVVLLTPVTFGGYSSQLKKGLDHLIGLISPFFTTIDGETHHHKRYDRYPSLLAAGLEREASEEESAIFEALVARNAINMHAAAHAVVVCGHGADGPALQARFDSALAKIGAAA